MYTTANLAALRVKKDIAELSRQRLNATHASTTIDFPDGVRNLLKLKVGVSMTAGLYQGATFHFLLTIPPSYPFHAPTVVCTTRTWHPNIDLHTGFVSLPMLTKDWRPVLSINTVVFALQLMFLEPTEEAPVNEAAAAALANPDLFREQVRRTLAGGFLFGVEFEAHGHGAGGSRGGAAQKRKRPAEGMDTDAVQTTLEAMRIQGDETAGDLTIWKKRSRHEPQSNYIEALQQQQQHQQQAEQQQQAHQQQRQLEEHHHQQRQRHSQQQQQQQPPQTSFGVGGSGTGVNAVSTRGGSTAFDRLRQHAIIEAESAAIPGAGATVATQAAASLGLRCGGLQAGVPQPTGGAVTGGVGWPGGQFHAVPASRLQ